MTIQKIFHLASIEWLKFKDYMFAKIVVGLFTVLFFFALLYSKEVVPQASPPLPDVITFFEFPTVWDYQGLVGNWLVCILLGFLLIYLVTMEASEKTMRQNIINGLTRKEYFFGKIALIASLSLYATLIYILSTLIFGLTHTSDIDFSLVFDTNYAPLRFFLMCMGYLSFAFLIALLLRKSGLSIIIYFAWVFVIEFLLRMLQLYYFKNRATLFYPINSMEDLTPNPLYNLPGMWMEKSWGFNPLLSYLEAFITVLIYLSIFIFLSWKLMQKRSL